MGKPASRVGDMHFCPMFDGFKPHVGGPVLAPGKPTVLIGNLPAATVGDLCMCMSAPDVITKGSLGVFINGMPAARIGDPTIHGGRIVAGLPTVLIGDICTPCIMAQMKSFTEAAQNGTPFVEVV